MNESSLLEKKASIEQQFNALQEDIKSHQNSINTANEETYRLQGEYRLINQYLEELTKTPEVKPKKGKNG